MKKTVRAALLGALLLTGGVLVAAAPVQDVNPARHPNLAAAQRLSLLAYNKLVAAQHANEWDMEGHAQRAKELLDEVNVEIKLAAEAANETR